MSKTGKFMAANIDPVKRIKDLSRHGNAIEVDPNTPVTRYYRSGTEFLRMAQVYLNEGNYENAFILYMKYMTLFIDKIHMHPDFPKVKNEVKPIRKHINEEIMPTAEKLRTKLLDRYQREYEQYLIEREIDETREYEKERERERERERQRNKNANSFSGNGTTNVTLIPAARLHVQMDNIVEPTAPVVGLLDQVVYPNDFPIGGKRSNLPNVGLLLPTENDKELAKGTNLINKPSFDRSQKPLYDRADSLLAGSLRTVVIPQNTMEVFLQLVQRNTNKNVETCGILAGHLAHNRLFITHMIIPKQQGTADSCNTMNEEEIFDVQDQQNLITLGWIHTHPSQTAFLSSVDLHTHCSYQIMMPEAIAIVCAPKYNSTGFFLLTPNYGLDYIAQCRQTGFHPHPNDPPLFMEAQHIQLDASSKIEVVDLRR